MDTSLSGFIYYPKALNAYRAAASFGYLYDANQVINTDNGNRTGTWRPAVPADFAANVNVSGLNLTVGSVAITGNPPVQVSNPVYSVSITGNNPIYVTGAFASNSSTLVTGGLIGITGVPNVNITNSVFPVTGSVISINTGVRSVLITNTTPINVTGYVTTVVTGSVSASFDSTSIVNSQSTGNSYLAFISGRELVNGILLSGISGALGANLNDPAYITGSVNVYNTLPLNVSGIVTISPTSKTSTSSSTPSGAAPWTSMTQFLTGMVLAANPNRIMFFIQNIHTGSPLYVNLGAAAVNTGNFSFILNPSTVINYGGSSFSDDRYRGAVTVSGGAWISWEL